MLFSWHINRYIDIMRFQDQYAHASLANLCWPFILFLDNAGNLFLCHSKIEKQNYKDEKKSSKFWSSKPLTRPFEIKMDWNVSSTCIYMRLPLSRHSSSCVYACAYACMCMFVCVGMPAFLRVRMHMCDYGCVLCICIAAKFI